MIRDIPCEECIVSTPYGDVLPSGRDFAAATVELISREHRETILYRALQRVYTEYDYIFLDCPPSLELITVNALAAADSVLIPMQCEYYALEGITDLISSIRLCSSRLNSRLHIEGILLTMVDNRTNYARDISLMVYDTYSSNIKVFSTEIPMSVRASEVSVEGGSIYEYDPRGKVACAYRTLTEEVLKEK